MSADLALFALDPGDLTLREDLARYEQAWAISDEPRENEISFAEHRHLMDRLFAYPHVEVGQVSWMKMWLTGEPGPYVPGPIERCVDLIGDGVLLTPGMAKAITVAFNQPNRSIYRGVHYRRVTDPDELARLRRAASKGCRRDMWTPALRHPDIAVHRAGRGVESGRFVKKFLQAHIGAWVTHLSV